MEKRKSIILAIVVVFILGAIVFLQSKKAVPKARTGQPTEVLPAQPGTRTGDAEKAARYPRAREIVSPSGFVNTDGITIADLIGKKVILVDFWTYTCINCQRTLPFLTAWYRKYKDQGLEIVGVHTPEFEFEKNRDNVARAAKQFGVEYPVVLDNDYATWNAYGNRYWPHEYLIDIDGYIVHDHIGEGGYDETEKKIQELLTERMQRLGEKGSVASGIVEPKGAESVSPGMQLSPEIYFGAARNEFLGNGERGKVGMQTFVAPKVPAANTLYLDGDWGISKEYAENAGLRAKIVFRYKAQKVFIVASGDEGTTVTIMRDGKPLGKEAGSDVKDSKVSIRDERLYRLIEDPAGYGEHTLEITIDGIVGSGFRAFTFTFG